MTQTEARHLQPVTAVHIHCGICSTTVLLCIFELIELYLIFYFIFHFLPLASLHFIGKYFHITTLFYFIFFYM